MELARKELMNHFKFLQIKGINLVNIEKDGSYACVTQDGVIAVKAPAMEDYNADYEAFITDIPMFYRILKNLESPEGDVDVSVGEDEMTFTTSQLKYSYILGDVNSVRKVITAKDIDELVKDKKFTKEYQLTPTLIKNIIQMIDTLNSESLTISSAKDGFTVKVHGNLHSAQVTVSGSKLGLDDIVVKSQPIVDVLKSFTQDAIMSLKFDKEGELLVFKSDNGFEFYVLASEEVA